MGLYKLRDAKDDFLFRAAGFAYSRGISPNAVTILGLCFGVSAGAMFWLHQVPLGFALCLISVFCDVLDGTIARKFNLETMQGKVLDSVCDRIVELAFVLGALGGGIIGPWGIVAFIGSATLLLLLRVISHRRGASTDYALFGRTERLFFIMLGLLMPWVNASTVCFILAGAFGLISSLQITLNLPRKRGASG